MKAYECPQCRGAGEYAYPGDGLRTTRCAKCKGTGFVDFPPLKPVFGVARDLSNPRVSYIAWDNLADLGPVPTFPRPTGPSRTPSTRCESGKRPYCTCDTCF